MGSKVFLLVRPAGVAYIFYLCRRNQPDAAGQNCIQPVQRGSPRARSRRNLLVRVLDNMGSATFKIILAILSLALLLVVVGVAQGAAQQNPGTAGENAAQALQPSGAGPTAADPAIPPAEKSSGTGSTAAAAKSKTSSASSDNDDNPYDPLLEVPPPPKGKPTLIGGTATSVDQVRYRVTVSPFGGGAKLKLFLDERTHIFRNGTETTVLGIHKGDRVYADTMLDGSRIFAKNVRVVTDPSIAEVRGQVVATDPQRGTIRVQDQLSARPVTFAVSGTTKYSSLKGNASAGDVRPGSLVDVQFAVGRANRDIAQEIMVLARPGDDYIFSGTVTNLDMRSATLALENRSDQQTYELHFNPAAIEDTHQLKLGAEVTAHAVFDGKQYKASNLRIEKANPQNQNKEGQTEVQ
jgi:hypothetical protein